MQLTEYSLICILLLIIDKFMSKEKYFEAILNPLAFIEIEEPWASSLSKSPNNKDFIKNFCSPGMGYDIPDLIERCKQIASESHRLIGAPNEEHILARLIWPLRHAKASYVVGNYLGTISLCGMVSEMASILLFEMSNIKINDVPMDEHAQKKLFGRSFEKLGQERRVSILSAYNLIDSNLKGCFDLIREIRRHYLHIYSYPHTDISNDALEVFTASIQIVTSILGLGIREDKFILNPLLLKYLEDRGLISDK